jgi:hypothetical protein
MMRRFDLGLAVGIAAMIWGAVAHAETGTIPLMGSGRESCGQLIATIGNDPLLGPGEERFIETKTGYFVGEYAKYQGWLMGFVAGFNFNAAEVGEEHLVRGIDLAGMDLWMRNWCNQHPTEKVFWGAVAFIREMRTNAAGQR